MNKKIIFLESTTKKKTIKSFLGSNYVIFATSGHLREIKKKGPYNLGVDLEKFVPEYEIMKEKSGLVRFWRNFISKEKVDQIYLATDPDREGEAIAAETVELLELKPSQYKRLLFYEITPKSINNSLQNPIGIDDNLVQAQLSRQVLDRMIGFCLSKVIQKKLNASSAGRVQSIVLKLIVEREKEIKEQEKKKKFTIDAVCKLEGHNLVAREVDEEGNTKVYETRSRAADSLEKIDKELKVVSFFEEKKIIPPKPPLITSSMIFEAKSRLGFNVEQTTRNAQKLYEGINLDNKKRIGLITYPRTDSTRMNEDFIRSAYKYIEEKWNKENYNFSPLWKKDCHKKGVNIQNAHESIHPTSLRNDPEKVRKFLTNEEYLLYKLIFEHSLSSLMISAKVDKLTYRFSSKFGRTFSISERIVESLGFFNCNKSSMIVYNVREKELIGRSCKYLFVSNFEIKDYIENKKIRYNEGSVVKELENIGVGRPSTYNTFGRILVKRKYVEIDKKGYFYPTNLGISVNELLQRNFSSLINENYTAFLEEDLDKISSGNSNYFDFIKSFWSKFYTLFKPFYN